MSLPVLFDLQAAQSAEHRHRGIARYVVEQALAICAASPAHVSSLLLNPALALPDALDRLVATGKLAHTPDAAWDAAAALHVASPFELPAPLDDLLPPKARERGLPWIATFYDMIPLLMPDYYLEDPGFRRRYRARVQLVRAADAVLTLSEATRRDAITHLGLDPARVVVVGAGTGPSFVPPTSREAAAAEAEAAVAGLSRPYAFYTGSYERRKNLERLLEAWARLPTSVRSSFQLVITCPLKPLERNHLDYLAADVGLGDDLVLTGYVTDEVLLRLYQGTELFVFPSLYEGYGLPVAEALACGAPVIASNASSLPEIVGAESLFDPEDTDDMAAALERGLTAPALRGRLLAAAGRPPSTWAEVAEATIAVYDRVTADRRPRAPRRHRPFLPSERPEGRQLGAGGSGDGDGDGERLRIAVATPQPPHGGTAAAAERSLLGELARRAEVHAFVAAHPDDGLPWATEDGPAGWDPPDGVARHPLSSLVEVEALTGCFDAVIYGLADDPAYGACLASLLRRRPGIVLLHDVNLGPLYAAAVQSGWLGGEVPDALRELYGPAVPARLGGDGTLSRGEAQRAGALMLRGVARRAQRLVVTSEGAAVIARLELGPELRHLVTTVPWNSPADTATALHLLATRIAC